MQLNQHHSPLPPTVDPVAHAPARPVDSENLAKISDAGRAFFEDCRPLGEWGQKARDKIAFELVCSQSDQESTGCQERSFPPFAHPADQDERTRAIRLFPIV